jgi:D-alanyl-D-alanine carboxypeptidase
MNGRVTVATVSLGGLIPGGVFPRRRFPWWTAALLSLLLLLADPGRALAKYAAFVVDADTGRVLYAENADDRNYPASLTKMMTLYLLFEDLEAGHITLRSPLVVTARAEHQAPSSLSLRRGQTIRVNTAIQALVIKSANDVAVTVAENLAPSEAMFAVRMNAKARQLGMTNTTFRNASGLPHREQVTTARDLARLARALQRDFPKYYKYFSLKEFDWEGQTIPTHNNLVANYPGADGLKTGFIQASGFNLAASAVRDGHRLIAVVMGGNTARWRDQRTADLLDRGFEAVVANRPARPDAGESRLAGLTEDERTVASGIHFPSQGEGDVDAAAAVPSAKRRTPVTVSAHTGGAWAIQVGAYSDRTAAEAAARSAMATQTDAAAAHAQSRIDTVKTGHKALYRARIVGLSASDAQRSCALMKRDSRPCLVIKP